MAATAQKKEKLAVVNKPVWSMRRRGVHASVFANQTEIEGRQVTFHKATILRTYKEGAEWKTTNSFGRDDLPVASLLLERAHEFILDAEAEGRKEENGAE